MISQLKQKIKNKNIKIIFPEGDDTRVQETCKKLASSSYVQPVLLASKSSSKEVIENVDYINISSPQKQSSLASQYYELRKHKGITMKEASSKIKDPLVACLLLLESGEVEGIVSGAVYLTSDVVRNSIQILGLEKNTQTVSSYMIMEPPENSTSQNPIIFSDCGVVPEPTENQLVDIAKQSSDNYERITSEKSKVAFLSFSTKGSSKHESAYKMASATKIFQKRFPTIISDGELQFDSAFVPSIGASKNPGGSIKGDANVFIFPDLNSANIAYKISERLGGYSVKGPLLQGLNKPSNDLSRGCSVADIYDVAIITAAQSLRS